MSETMFPKIPSTKLHMDIDADKDSFKVGDGDPFFDKDSVTIESNGNRVTIKPSYENGTFDTMTVHADGTLSLDIFGGLVTHRKERQQDWLRRGALDVLRTAQNQVQAGSTLAGNLAKVVSSIEKK